jgi:hypothetical protein
MSDHLREVPTSPHFRSASIREAVSGATGDALLSAKALHEKLSSRAGLAADPQPIRGFIMIRNLKNRLFGSRQTPNKAAVALKKEKTLARVNESDVTSAKPRTRRTVGVTEARLRAANQQSWMTSTKGWSDFFGRFTASAKR